MQLKNLYMYETTLQAYLSVMQAHKTLVNSFFTADTFARTFHTLFQNGPQPGILYPAVAASIVPSHLARVGNGRLGRKHEDEDIHTYVLTRMHLCAHFFTNLTPCRLTFFRSLFLSINRFERKKNLSLALRAYANYRQNTVAVRGFETRLVLAGGYDERLIENVNYLQELKK